MIVDLRQEFMPVNLIPLGRHRWIVAKKGCIQVIVFLIVRAFGAIGHSSRTRARVVSSRLDASFQARFGSHSRN